MTKIIQRHDTAANWTSVNPTLSQGEFGIETDTGKFKIGDGQKAWTNLPYASSGGAGGSGTQITSADGSVEYSELALGDGLSVVNGNLTATSGGSTRNVGELVPSLLPQTDASLHLVDGALINSNGAYADFVNYIAELYNTNPTANYFTDEETWQTSITNYGVCGKFVYDSVTNTVRLPKVTGMIEGTIDLNALGDLVEAGLPNITGTLVGYAITNQETGSSSGALYINPDITDSRGASSAGTDRSAQVAFDASRSSSIYKNGFNKVQPQTIKGFIYICIATSKKTNAEVNIDNVMTDVNSKADMDLTNTIGALSKSSKNYFGGLSMPSNKYIDLTLGASGSTYTAPANGYYCMSQNVAQDKYLRLCTVLNEMEYYAFRVTAKGGAIWGDFILPVKKGDIVKLQYSGIISSPHAHFRFIYAQGESEE